MSRRGAPQLLAWTKSAAWRAIASRTAKANLAELAKRPRCGATCRSTGEPCKKPVLKGRSRCRIHGGATARGRGWHRLQPAATAEKTNQKVADHIRAAAKRSKRLAKMGPEELARHKKWQAAHVPDSPEARASRRELRRSDREARESIQRLAAEPVRQATPLDETLAELRAELELLQQYRTGVFA